MGFDKTVVTVDGVPCAERAAGLMATLLAPVVEVGPGRCGMPAVREEPAGAGPLAAIAAGTGWLGRHGGAGLPAVVVAGDLPFVTPAVLSMLRDWPGRASVVPVVDGRPQPLLARWSADALGTTGGMVARGAASLRPLLERDDVELIDASRWPAEVSAAVFADLDTPGDLERLGLGC